MGQIQASATAAERFRAYRVLHGLTQSELAARCGCGQPQILRIETGRRGPSLALAVRIEIETGISAESWPNLAALTQLLRRRGCMGAKLDRSAA